MLNRKDKKGGVMMIVLLFLIFFTILIIGFAAVLLTGILDYTSETVTPIMTDLGMAGDTNLSQAAEVTFGVTDTLVNSLPWLVAFGYMMMLIFTIVFISTYDENTHPAFIGFYFGFIILLIMGAIVISNMYQDIWEGTDEIALKMQEQTAMSYMMLYSPMIFGVIAFIAGIYLFARDRSNIGGVGV